MFLRPFLQIPQLNKRNNYEIELQMIKFRFLPPIETKYEFPIDVYTKIEDEI